jgi:ABC-2 type transport system permease protein
MILRIAQKEITETLRDGRFRASAAIVFTLLAASLLLGWRHHAEVSAQHNAARQSTRNQWLNQGKKNPHSAAHYGVYAFKPNSPLALVDHGTNDYTGVAVWLEAHKQNEFKYRPAQDATSVQRFGELTGAAVLQLLVPLLIILLAFDAFSGERELGTLRQLLSLGVKPGSLTAGKSLGISASLLMLLVPAAALGSLAISAASSSGEITGALPRAAWMTLGYLLYYGALIGVTLAVSALASSSRTALIALLGFWMLNALVAPRAASDIAKSLRPAPSAFEFAQTIESAMKNGIDGHDPAAERTSRLKQDLLKKYNVSRIEDLPVNFTGVSLQEGENHGNAVYDRVFGQLWKTFAEQETIHRTVALFAPGLATRSVSMAFAGADFSHHAHFATAAEEYRRGIQRTMNDDIMRNAGKSGPYLAADELWSKVSAFDYKSPDAGWVLQQQGPALLILSVWCVLAIAAAYWAVGRLRVF